MEAKMLTANVRRVPGEWRGIGGARPRQVERRDAAPAAKQPAAATTRPAAAKRLLALIVGAAGRLLWLALAFAALWALWHAPGWFDRAMGYPPANEQLAVAIITRDDAA